VTEGRDEQRDVRKANARVTPEGRTEVTVTATLFKARYAVLRDTAEQVCEDGYHEAAIVMAHTACEVCTAAILTEALRAKGVEPLADPIDELLTSYNLANNKVRNLYVALTGHCIQDERFWSKFKECASKRNKVVHRGHSATADEARQSIDATKDVIDYLLQNRP
jgi:hypothetical protein